MMPGSGDKSVLFRQDLASLSDVVQMRETVAGKNGDKDKDKERGTQPAIPPTSAANSKPWKATNARI